MNETKPAAEHPSATAPAAQSEPLSSSCAGSSKREVPGKLRKVIGLLVALAALAGAGWSFYSGASPLNGLAILILGGLVVLRICGVLSGG